MSEYSATQVTVKVCRNDASCVHPNGPVLPPTEFYQQRGTKDGLEGICKVCKRKRQNARAKKPKGVAGHATEQMVIDELAKQGIYAVPGKASEYQWVDVVAWGCVRIEVKFSNRKAFGQHQWSMGHKPKRESERSDLVVLVAQTTKPKFFVFSSSDPVFYHEDGTPKKGVAYLSAAHHRLPGNHLTPEIMQKALSRWELVERVRQRIIREITLGS